MDRLDVYREWITNLCALTKPEVYVEIGIQSGVLFYMVAPYCGKVIGVDIVDAGWNPLPNAEFRVSSSFDFFREWNEKADLIFIDADHSYLQVYADCLQALKHLNENGIVMLHDTWPYDMSLTVKEYCGDAYKAVKMLRRRKNVDVLTMPFINGLTLVSPRPEWHR